MSDCESNDNLEGHKKTMHRTVAAAAISQSIWISATKPIDEQAAVTAAISWEGELATDAK